MTTDVLVVVGLGLIGLMMDQPGGRMSTHAQPGDQDEARVAPDRSALLDAPGGARQRPLHAENDGGDDGEAAAKGNVGDVEWCDRRISPGWGSPSR